MYVSQRELQLFVVRLERVLLAGPLMVVAGTCGCVVAGTAQASADAKPFSVVVTRTAANDV